MPYEFKDDMLAAIVARKQSKQAREPIEKAWEPTKAARIISPYNLDLALVAVLYLAAIAVAVIVVIAFSQPSQGQSGQSQPVLGPGLPIIFGTAVFGTFIELLRRTYDTAIKRLSTADLFISEMLSFMVMASGNIIGEFVRLYDKIGAGQTAKPPTLVGSSAQGQALPSGFADAAGKENYFAIFDKNSSDLGALDPAVVNDITAFYTFLKAARDATGAMLLWDKPHYDPDMKKEDITSIIYHCFLMTLHGKLALDRLIASENNRSIVDDIFAGVQLQCFSFLDYVLPKDDFRRPRIGQRRDTFRSLRAKHDYDFGP